MSSFENTFKEIAERGKRLTVDAMEFLENLGSEVDVKELLKEVLEQTEDVFISLESIKKALEKTKQSEFAPSVRLFQPEAKSIDSKLEVLYDPGKKISPGVAVKDFIDLFRSRYKKEVSIIRRGLGLRAFDGIEDALTMRKGEASLTVGLLVTKRSRKKGMWMEIEDFHNKMVFFVSVKNLEAYRKARQVPLDSVIAVRVRKISEGFMMAEEIYLPEVNSYEVSRSEEEIYVVLTSDLHAGSKMFLKDLFKRFILWLNGQYGDDELMRIASRVKYIVFAGDLVDGVGIYPNQELEQEEFRVRRQYQSVIKLLEQIPEYIDIVIIPGNHDATRRALPQPPILREYVEELYESDRCVLAGNPVNLSLHGVNIYSFHGRSLDDCMAMMPGSERNNVSEAMKTLLRVRHISPTYGLHTRISPQETDDLVIPMVPDIFHAGHIHINDHTYYKNTLIVNSGTWQGQTKYQREIGLIPTPGLVPVVNLANLEIRLVKFL